MSSRPRARILLVDDRPENLLALEAILAPLGQELVTADSGEAALRALLNQDFAVILLDVQMPGFDGYETAELIKARQKTRHVPIIFLTAVDPDERAEQRGYGAGAVDYLFKPFDPVVLRAKVNVFIDLHHLKREAEDLAHRALHDPLTGLPNRVLFRDRLELALAHSRRLPSSVGVFYIDLDGFKAVNDTLGHEQGDVLLVQVAARLRDVLRGADTVTRLGGDEFAILSDSVEPEGAVEIADRVLEALHLPFELPGGAVTVAASVGIALSDGSDHAAELLGAADEAMYGAKAAGGSRWLLHAVTDAVPAELDDRLVPRTALGHEATASWGVEIRDEHGAAVVVDDLDATAAKAVLESALAQARDSRLLVSLPVAPALLAGLVPTVSAALDAVGVAEDRVCLEIPAQSLVAPRAGLLRALEDLSYRGLRLAVANAGSGGASPAALAGLPLEWLVLDAATDSAIIRGVTALAHALDLRVVATGVGTPEAAERLRELGCDLGQGEGCRQPVA